MRTYWIRIACVLVLTLTAVVGCDDGRPSPSAAPTENASPGASPDAAQTPKPTPEPTPTPYTRTAVLTAVGDVMMHSPQIPAGYDPETDAYDYKPFFAEVKPLLEQGDWVIANLETPLAGEELGYAGYPQFNAPAELADALKWAGFNMLSTANNHSLDRREQGVLNTLANLKQRGFVTAGTAADEEEAKRIPIVVKQDIALAFLSYTYGTNGIPIPEGKPYLVNRIDEAAMLADIARAREEGADVVSVAVHFGNEYEMEPNAYQIELATSLIAGGADIVLGSHPHVIQPYEWIETAAPDGTPRKGIVIYSLGNFISNQGPEQGTAKYTDVGVIFELDVRKTFPAGTVELGEVRTTPTWVHKYYEDGKRRYRVLPIEAVLAAKTDPMLDENTYNKIEAYLQEIDLHLQSLSVKADTLPSK